MTYSFQQMEALIGGLEPGGVVVTEGFQIYPLQALRVQFNASSF